jgi:hypothetical protein
LSIERESLRTDETASRQSDGERNSGAGLFKEIGDQWNIENRSVSQQSQTEREKAYAATASSKPADGGSSGADAQKLLPNLSIEGINGRTAPPQHKYLWGKQSQNAPVEPPPAHKFQWGKQPENAPVEPAPAHKFHWGKQSTETSSNAGEKKEIQQLLPADQKRLDYMNNNRQIDHVPSGSSLWSIATRNLKNMDHKVDSQSVQNEITRIAKLNGMQNPDLLSVNQCLKLYGDSEIKAAQDNARAKAVLPTEPQPDKPTPEPEKTAAKPAQTDRTAAQSDKTDPRPVKADSTVPQPEKTEPEKTGPQSEKQALPADKQTEKVESSKIDEPVPAGMEKYADYVKALYPVLANLSQPERDLALAAIAMSGKQSCERIGYDRETLSELGGSCGGSTWGVRDLACPGVSGTNMAWNQGKLLEDKYGYQKDNNFNKAPVREVRIAYCPSHIGMVVPVPTECEKELTRAEKLDTRKVSGEERRCLTADRNMSFRDVAAAEFRACGIKTSEKSIESRAQQIAELNGQKKPGDRVSKGAVVDLHDQKGMADLQKKVAAGHQNHPWDGIGKFDNNAAGAWGEGSLGGLGGYTLLKPPANMLDLSKGTTSPYEQSRGSRKSRDAQLVQDRYDFMQSRFKQISICMNETPQNRTASYVLAQARQKQ